MSKKTRKRREKWLSRVRRELWQQTERCIRDEANPRRLTDSADAVELLARLDIAIGQIRMMRDTKDCWNTKDLDQIKRIIRMLLA